MLKTQIQLPNELYRQAKAIAAHREWSLAEVVRRGIEHMVRLYPVGQPSDGALLPVLEPDRFLPDVDALDLRALAHDDETSRGVL